MSDVPLCLESQGCHLFALSYFLSGPLALSVFVLTVHSPDFIFPESSQIYFVQSYYIIIYFNIFCMSLVEQLGGDSW